MDNLVQYIREKFFVIIGIIVGLVVLIILFTFLVSKIGSGGTKGYDAIENRMVQAAKKYYETNSNMLPKMNGSTVKVTTDTLISSDLLKVIYDVNDKKSVCSGYVNVTNNNGEYVYSPILKCGKNYDASYLVDKIKEQELDVYGNGVYELNGEYVFRGDYVSNYIKFNDELWRIVKVSKDGDIKLVLAKALNESYVFDNAYNAEYGINYGINTNYLRTAIRKTLNDYYDNNISKESKNLIVSKDICVGRVSIGDSYSKEKECSILRKDEKIGLLNLTDYKNASLGEGCNKIGDRVCVNYNYLSSDDIYTWMLNAVSDNTYEAIYLHGELKNTFASSLYRVNPVVYITGNTVASLGDGSLENPYIIKNTY